ncbi:phage virion morphogenesis protein [Desulforegula conservatrix]|uniref:phage virion morphogenesis protein n=1 Tax=Desulforegula conservatrix TaxID=153026 RepID=UPI00040427BA|nr:phage virion morphogenesis protein [Desulforegula conservatrix]
MSFQVTIEGADLVSLRIGSLISSLPGAQRKLVSAVAAEVETQTRRRIENEKTGPDGSKWPDWSPATVKLYAKLGKAGHMLHQEGKLLDSIRAKAISDEQAEVSANRVYAAIQQVGGLAGRGHKVRIPARPYLGISAENAADIDAVVSGLAAKILGEAGL